MIFLQKNRSDQKNVVYNNINLRALGEVSIMKGWNDTSTVSGVTLNNVRVGGVAVNNLTDLKITDTNSYAAEPKIQHIEI
ncbi:hypothetical protein ACFTAO_11130 [Paenibacillus rhizoplanae]